MKKIKIVVTGHRPDKIGKDYRMNDPLSSKIASEMEKYINSVIDANEVAISYSQARVIGITGMALGIDTLFARVCIKMNIPFIAAIPFKGQERRWFDSSIKEYHSLLQKAYYIQVCDINKAVTYDEYLTLSETPYRFPLLNSRNIWMVDQLTEPEDSLLGVFDGSSGGTANCIRYAKGKENPPFIEIINPSSIRWQIFHGGSK